jgi:hypothetical protein
MNLLKRITQLEARAHSGCITLTMPDGSLRQITGKRLIKAGAECGRGVWKQDAIWCRESIMDDAYQ